jgi:SAM-dependent methyltransferase
MKYLEIGANKLKGPEWAYIDTQDLPGAIVHDMRYPLHFIQDNTIEGIYTEHFIEHLDKADGINALKEALRILKPGSTIRIVWPNGEVVSRLRSNEDLSNDEFVLVYGELISTLDWNTPNKTFDRLQDKCADSLSYQRGEHKYLWCIDELIECLQSIGFTKVFQEEYMRSTYEPFNAIDTNCRIRELHSAVIEAIK